jgi:hypothetical protein
MFSTFPWELLWQLQGQITVNNWQQFVPTLLIVLTTIIYIPLSVVDIIQQVRWVGGKGAGCATRRTSARKQSTALLCIRCISPCNHSTWE